MTKFPEVLFSEIFQEPPRNGIYKSKEFQGHGTKLVKMNELFMYPFIESSRINFDSIELTENEKQKLLLQENDLLFSRTSVVADGVGKCALIKSTAEDLTYDSNIFRIRLDNNKVHPLFYYYYFSSPEGRAKVKSLASGAAITTISGTKLSGLFVPNIPLPTQRRIADILSAYDDLIENNTRRIRILEGMAQAIYQEWFGKVGKESLPEGWELKALGDIAKEVRRSVQPNEIDPETPYFGLEHLPRKSLALSDWGKASDVQSTKLAFKKGEILFGKIRPYFHKVGVAPLDGVASSDTIVIVPKLPEYFGLVLSCVFSEDFVNQATLTAQGTKMPRANWDVLVKYPVVLPPKPILEKFNQTIQDIVDLLTVLLFKNANLRQARDLLLPRLVSGEIAV